MNTEVKFTPVEVPVQVAAKIIGDVIGALNTILTQNNKFIVNDTLWYAIQRGKATPTVVNSARFITGRFQKFLNEKAGWAVDHDVERQEIDGYVEMVVDGGMALEKKGALEILEAKWHTLGKEPDDFFSELYQYYVARNSFLLSSHLAPFRHLFTNVVGKSVFRVGLEFETGNIASSFRAFSKLNSLFKTQKIDAGVFITSLDKSNAACRIWPSSNRNGSFEELQKRDYRRNIALPLFEIAFSPDGIDSTAPYLASDGSTYIPDNTGNFKIVNGVNYCVFHGENRLEILLPHAPENNIS